MRRAAALLSWVVAVLPVVSMSGARAAERVELPTEADLIGVAVGAETILYGPKGIETLLPGPVEDREVVTVGVLPEGAPAAVGVRQRLVVHGLGDFRFKVSGPAQTVEALPGSEAEPGLRKGAVLWQGFSADEKVLASEMALFADQEAIRLPLHVSYEQTGGEDAPDGDFSARIAITNRSASPVTVTSARGDPLELAGVLDRMVGRLEEGARPRPGEDGVPSALTALGGQKALTREIPATFRVRGELGFEGGTLSDATADGGRVLSRGGAGPTVRFSGYVGAEELSHLEVSVRGTARGLGRPVLRMTARPAPPPPSALRPEGGGTWTGLVESGAVKDARPLWNRIMETAWGVAKLRQYDAYLGNPDPTGESSTVYRFRFAVPEAPSGPLADTEPGPATTPLLAVTAILAVLLLAFVGVLLWSLL